MTPKNVLIVEDEMITAKYVEGVLKKLGTQKTTTATTSTRALEETTKIEFDLILMDINIKGHLDGIETARRILELYNVPIIFVTAYNDVETLERTYELAPYGFISKPFTSKDLEIALNIGYSRFKLEQSKTKTIEIDKVRLTSEYFYYLDKQQFFKNNEHIKLNYKQNRLLYILVKNRNSNVSHEQIMQFVWENSVPSDSSLRNLIYSLRIIVPEISIETSSKSGYMLSSY